MVIYPLHRSVLTVAYHYHHHHFSRFDRDQNLESRGSAFLLEDHKSQLFEFSFSLSLSLSLYWGPLTNLYLLPSHRSILGNVNESLCAIIEIGLGGGGC